MKEPHLRSVNDLTSQSAIVIDVPVSICTCFMFCIVDLIFSYSATQPHVWNKTQYQCQSAKNVEDQVEQQTVMYSYDKTASVKNNQ